MSFAREGLMLIAAAAAVAAGAFAAALGQAASRPGHPLRLIPGLRHLAGSFSLTQRRHTT